jgi:hypothetical protein
MFSAIKDAIAIISALISLWRYLRDYVAEQKRQADERKRQEMDQAIKDAENAKTETDIWDSQGRIVRNKPGS